MNYRDWTASPQDFAALARLNTIQYPDAPVTAEGIERNWGFVDPQRPTLIRFVLLDGQEVALVETYPQGDGSFLLELIAPATTLHEYGPELLDYARQWAKTLGAAQWSLTIRQDDPRTDWLQRRGFDVQDSISEWTATQQPRPQPPGHVVLLPVGHDPARQESLRTALNTARQERNLPPFTSQTFKDDVLNFGLYRPDLLWLAQTPGGETIGGACLHVWDNAQHGELSWVSVSPGWRRRGLGTALVRHATQQADLPLTSTRLPGAYAHLSPLLTRAGFQQTDVWVTLTCDL
ncbi:GNAT family N-acetyltransferase [Deinococcus cavernae]|nr:GNAT family N-acetyltransferase [Deinococcus cavernae]